MIESIFIDLDETIANTVDHFINYHNLKNPYDDRENWGKRSVHELVGADWKEFWRVPGWEVWASIPKLPWADILVESCIEAVGIKNVHFLSSPVRSEGCAYGKQMWVEEHYKELSHQLILARTKHACVDKNSILIDDSEDNELAFKEAGKQSNMWLFPSFSNRKAEIAMLYKITPESVKEVIKW
jgi:5'(3')-deoxyribonucleotidase